MSDWPIELSGLPDTTDSVLAHRLRPTFTSGLSIDQPALALGGLGGVMAGAAAAACGQYELGAAVAAGGMLATAAAVRTVRRRARIRGIEEEFDSYEAMTSWLADSPNKVERNHVYLGKIHGLPDDVPNLVSLKLIRSHLIGLGATRSSKTQRLVIAILLQLLRRPDTSIIVLDAKGDRPAFHLLRKACRKLGLPFTYFSLDPRIPSHLYCMERDPAWLALQPIERAQVRTRAFALEQTETGSEGFWSAKGRDPLIDAYTLEPHLPSSRAVLARLADKAFRRLYGMSSRDYDNASHLRSSLKHRAGIPHADPTPSDGIPASYFEHAVSVERALTQPSVTYLYLPAMLDPVGCRFIAREVMYLATTRARTLPTKGRPHLYIVGEEAPCFIQSSIGLLLKQARDTGVSFLLTFQNASDMRLKDEDLRELLLTNTAVKVAFSMKDATTRDYFEQLSGERRELMNAETTAVSDTPTGQSVGRARQQREVVVPRLGPPEFDLVNAHHSLAVFDGSPCEEFTRLKHPVIIDLPFPVSETEFDACATAEWPEPVPGETIRGIDIRRPGTDPPPPPSPVTPAPPPPTPTRPAKPKGKKHRRKPPTPAQQEQAAEAAAYLRRVADEL